MSRYRRKHETMIKDMIAVQFQQTVLFLQPYSCQLKARPIQLISYFE